jgi:hypothetical protein
MGSYGRKIAVEYGETLPEFANLKEAKPALMKLKKKYVEKLNAAVQSSTGVALDYSPDSLVRLEAWYFEQVSKKRKKPSPQELAEWCAFYFGEVVVKTIPDTKWVVESYAFSPGHYTIGVSQGKYFTVTLGSFYDTFHDEKNTTRDCMWRKYHKTFLRNPRVFIMF